MAKRSKAQRFVAVFGVDGTILKEPGRVGEVPLDPGTGIPEVPQRDTCVWGAKGKWQAPSRLDSGQRGRIDRGIERSKDTHLDPVAGQHPAKSGNHIGQTASLGKGKDFRGDETNSHSLIGSHGQKNRLKVQG